MMRFVLCITILLAVVGVFSLIPIPARANSIYFDDTSPDTLCLGNSHYELILSKNNGAILSITDKENSTSLTLGSRYGFLWGAVFPETTPDYIGGGSYSASGANRFNYTWNSDTAALTLTYTGDPSADQRVDATVTITAYQESVLDMQLVLENEWGGTMQNAILPSDLLFADDAMDAAYGPFLLPGVCLTSGFFTDDRSYTPTYPSDAAFADYLSLEVNSSQLTIYTVNPDETIHPVTLGFVDDDAHQTDTFFTYHSFHTWVLNGDTYTSPIVRFRIGQDPPETIVAYRDENGIADYPSVAEKLGERFEELAQAPLIKADAWRIDKPFREWIPDLDRLPSPALLHPVAFQPRGHDENYPDLLPPDSSWGSVDDFRAMVDAAHAKGMLVMPYTNPTWWDDESPTLQNLPAPLIITDVATLDANGQPVYETYDGHGGYVISPHVPFVQQKLAQLMDQWQDDISMDCVFEDQIGARIWRRDFNVSAPSPNAYSNGWLTHTRTYADRCLMTEFGWDRLAETETGFHGSVLTWVREFGYAAQHWGRDNWETYPLALWLLHDKVLLYQHNLSPHTMSEERAILTWNLAFGHMLSYDWQWDDNDPLGNAWLDLVSALQRTVAARCAGQSLTAFTHLEEHVTRTTFDDLNILANWDTVDTYAVDGHRIAPVGFLASTEDGSLLVGVFAGFFNGHELSAGEHYLIIEHTPHVVTVRQPIGEDAMLSVEAPADWQVGETLHVWAFDYEGNKLGSKSFWMEDRRVNFIYRQEWNGETVAGYELVNSIRVYLPLVWHSCSVHQF